MGWVAFGSAQFAVTGQPQALERRPTPRLQISALHTSCSIIQGIPAYPPLLNLQSQAHSATFRFTDQFSYPTHHLHQCIQIQPFAGHVSDTLSQCGASSPSRWHLGGLQACRQDPLRPHAGVFRQNWAPAGPWRAWQHPCHHHGTRCVWNPL